MHNSRSRPIPRSTTPALWVSRFRRWVNFRSAAIPLFDGVSHSYRVQAAKAKYESKAAELANLEIRISLEVWKDYYAMEMETENLKLSAELEDSASLSFNVSQGRYKYGVGNILELLTAQTVLINARQQKISVLSNWRSARIKLAASLGKLGMWAVE
ncbi:TolC family protein [Solimicrobium silvestre]|uniref:Outer membrane efflux protein n=1 Tax=Solimicrobium silvestre TaxID=2099400 RepID=A0A2S9GXN8_9BURK|nr:TolC family protein [Solimicrobium silvestre]PRC92479.1 Outer membrane efflux protein [Solimicrobium silvestre]